MRLIHPSNVPTDIERSAAFDTAVQEVRSLLDNLLVSGCPREIAEQAAKASDDPTKNRGILYRLIGGLLVHPSILIAVDQRDASYVEDVFFTAFDGQEIDVDMDPTVPFRTQSRDQ